MGAFERNGGSLLVIRWTVATVLCGAAACDPGAINAGLESDELDVVGTPLRFDALGLRAGDFILQDGVGAVVPPPGFGVALVADLASGGTDTLLVVNGMDRKVSISRTRAGLEAP